MAKKQKHPEHINLERYLISYADFITLLFATFIVLYALSQTDIKGFKELEKSMQEAFAAPSIVQGSEGMLQDNGSNSLFDTSQADSMITPLMMEYMSQKYEADSFKEIEKQINESVKKGELEGFETIETEKGLIIRFKDDYVFTSGSAIINPEAKTKLDKVGAIICKKFVLHYMRIEGHTDNEPLKNSTYPSNWELSGARASSIIRYFVGRFQFMPKLFTSVGFADTRPLVENTSETNKSKNRRVEILILRNKYKAQEGGKNPIAHMSKTEQENLQMSRMQAINRLQSISEAAKKLAKGNKKAEENAIILNQTYNDEIKRLSEQTKALDIETRQKATGKGPWLKPPATKIKDIKVFNKERNNK